MATNKKKLHDPSSHLTRYKI